MMRSALAAAALAFAALAGPAPAQTGGENWRQIQARGNIVFWIDMNSIRTVDGKRHFRIRTTEANGGGKVGYFDNAADCAGMTVDTLYGEVLDKGVIMRKQAMKPGEMRNRLDDDEGKLVYPLVCA
jgi:hypothetical protein